MPYIGGWVLQRDDGAFVADMSKSTSGSSYTKNVAKAQLFNTRDEAVSASCVENERPVPLYEMFGQ